MKQKKISGRRLQQYDDWDKSNIVIFQGEIIDVKLQNTYISEKENNVSAIYTLSTKSAKFKTKKGLGVGNTKDELIEAYKNYPNFSVNQGWDDKTISYFNLSDNDASTELSFKLDNNVVVEVSIYINEGC